MNTYSKAIPAAGAAPKPALDKRLPYTGSFPAYLQENKKHIGLTIACMSAGFLIFKLLYPFPDFFSDSYSYISAVTEHLDVNIWPIGYSWFLSLNSWFTHSPIALVWFQYLFFGACALYFYHTVVYFYTTGKSTRLFLYIFLFFNPLLYYLANYVTSDMIFAGLSVAWLTQMLWVLNRPRLYQVFLQAFLMFVAFTFRYNAMLYPLIAAVVFLVSQQKTWIKWAGVVSGPILIIPFIIFSSQAAKKMTGVAQFPPILGGWQWGNNGLYIRPFLAEDTTVFPTPETQELDRIARHFFSSLTPEQRNIPYEVDNFFIVHPAAPLKQYMSRHFHPRTQYEDVAAWGKAAIVFGQYGTLLVKRHPMAFLEYYILPNTKNYFIPTMGKFKVHNMGEDKLWSPGQRWFHYASPNIWSISKTGQETLLGLFPYLFMLLNVYYVMSFYLFLRRGGLRSKERFHIASLLIIALFLLLNFAFSVFATCVTLRYEIFPMIVLLAFSMLMTDWLEAHAIRKPAPRSATLPVRPETPPRPARGTPA